MSVRVFAAQGKHDDLPHGWILQSGNGKKLAGLRKRLGKHRTGASCLYINKLADVDVDVLREMIAIDLAYMNDKYPSG